MNKNPASGRSAVNITLTHTHTKVSVHTRTHPHTHPLPPPPPTHTHKWACRRGENFFFCLYSSCVRAGVTQCALVVAVILKCSTLLPSLSRQGQSAPCNIIARLSVSSINAWASNSSLNGGSTWRPVQSFSSGPVRDPVVVATPCQLVSIQSVREYPFTPLFTRSRSDHRSAASCGRPRALALCRVVWILLFARARVSSVLV